VCLDQETLAIGTGLTTDGYELVPVPPIDVPTRIERTASAWRFDHRKALPGSLEGGEWLASFPFLVTVGSLWRLHSTLRLDVRVEHDHPRGARAESTMV
jgi:hypothetical protein